MQYTPNKHKHPPQFILEQLLVRTKESTKKNHKKKKKKSDLPPIIKPNKIFMNNLIKEQQQKNRELTQKGKSTRIERNNSDRCIQEYKKIAVQSSTQLIPRSLRIITDKQSVKKISSLLSSPIAEEKKHLESSQKIDKQMMRSTLKQNKMDNLNQISLAFQSSKSNSVANHSQRLQPKIKVHSSPKNEFKDRKTVNPSETLQGQNLSLRTSSLRRIIRTNSIKVTEDDIIKQHLKTCFNDRPSKHQIFKYPSKFDEAHNFITKKERRMKIAFTKPLESSLYMKKQPISDRQVVQKGKEDSLQPWNSFYPPQTQESPHFLQ